MRERFTWRGRPASTARAAAVSAAAAAVLAAAACGGEPAPDAYGNFEAIEVVVSSQNAGPLLSFDTEEGDRLERGAVVAQVDTVQLALERAQLVAQAGATAARLTEAARQREVIGAQIDIARRTLERTRRLFDAQAATAQQLDQAERDYRTLAAQERAARAQHASVGKDVASIQARVEQLDDRIARGRVVNPVGGTVLATFARMGETVQPGTPLYRIADLDTLELRAYASGSQLGRMALGQAVVVKVDQGVDSLRALPGVISWISQNAEFTPTPVQTREERVDLVYAFKVRVANHDGLLKIGMPGEVTFGSASPPAVVGSPRP